MRTADWITLLAVCALVVGFPAYLANCVLLPRMEMEREQNAAAFARECEKMNLRIDELEDFLTRKVKYVPIMDIRDCAIGNDGVTLKKPNILLRPRKDAVTK